MGKTRILVHFISFLNILNVIFEYFYFKTKMRAKPMYVHECWPK